MFTDGSSLGSGALRRAGWAVVAADNVGKLKAAHGAVPSDVLPEQTSRDSADCAAATAGHITMDPLTLHVGCEGTLRPSKGQGAKPWALAVPECMSGTSFWSPTKRVRAVKVKGHATQRDVEALGALPSCSKRRNDHADIFAKKGADTQKPAFRVAKTVVACASLVKQAARWAAEAHVLLRFGGWDDIRAAAPRATTRPPRARMKRKHKEEIAAPASGQASDWLSPIVLSRFSQDSHLDPRTFRGHSLQLASFSILGVGLWTVPSSSAPNVERCTGNVRTRCAAAAANTLADEPCSCAN